MIPEDKAWAHGAGPLGGSAGPLPLSIGVAVYPRDGHDIQELFAQATRSATAQGAASSVDTL